MHKSGRTVPSAWEFAGHAATRVSLLKRGPTLHSCGVIKGTPAKYSSSGTVRGPALADSVEEAFHRVKPAASARVMPLAAGTDGCVKLFQQGGLLFGQVDWRLEGNLDEEIADSFVTYRGYTLASKPEYFF